MSNITDLSEYRQKKLEREHVEQFILQMKSIYELSYNTVWYDHEDEDSLKDL